mmetsp:Transcript_28656/g.61470  ORF Transcript_28656/g.61470 Transcript_28656/m.61470 type:complete len:133 (+) Transcript_28656:1492-1890(+)
MVIVLWQFWFHLHLHLNLHRYEAIAQSDEEQMEQKRRNAGRSIGGYQEGQTPQETRRNPWNRPDDNATPTDRSKFSVVHRDRNRTHDNRGKDPKELKGRPALHGNEQPVQCAVSPFSMRRSVYLQIDAVLGP